MKLPKKEKRNLRHGYPELPLEIIEDTEMKCMNISDCTFETEKGEVKFSAELAVAFIKENHYLYYHTPTETFFYFNGYFLQDITVGGFKSLIHNLLPKGFDHRNNVGNIVEAIKLSNTDIDFSDTMEGMNFLNGFLDLNNNRFTEDVEEIVGHNPTSCAPFEYNKKAKCPKWRKFLKEVFPDEETIKIFQMFIGSTLENHSKGRCSLILTGHGSNGKGIISSVMFDMFGKYARTTDFAEFDDRFGLADFDRYKMYIIPESNKMDVLPDGRFKAVVSGDYIATEIKGVQGRVSILPTGKVLICVNWLPSLASAEPAIKARLRTIFLPNQFTEKNGKRDPNLKDKLEDEYAGIFNWAVEGLEMFKENNCEIGETKEMKELKGTWMQRDDSVVQFFESDEWIKPTIIKPVYAEGRGGPIIDYKMKMSDIYMKYKNYCTREDSTIGNSFHKKRFKETMAMFFECGAFEKVKKCDEFRGFKKHLEKEGLLFENGEIKYAEITNVSDIIKSRK